MIQFMFVIVLLCVTHLYKTSHMSQKTKTEFFICAERGEDGL